MEETCMISTYTSKLKQLQIGDLIAKIPIIQGGMGVGISRSHLAGAVAKEGWRRQVLMCWRRSL